VLLWLTNGDALEQCIAATAQASMLVVGRPHGSSFSFARDGPIAMLVLREAKCPLAIVSADRGLERV
jgi:nucleotide-binding universal stress UspA family protein